MSNLLQVLASAPAPPAVNFAGSGTLEVPEVAYLTGSGTLVADHTYTFMDGGEFDLSGSGTLTVDDEETGQQYVQDHVLFILDDELDQAPTSVVAVLQGGFPVATVSFYIDVIGTPVYVTTTNSEGDLGPTSIPVSIPNGTNGGHTLYAVINDPIAGDITASAIFTIARGANDNPTDPAADTAPVEIPEALTANGVYRWVLQDLMPGGLGSLVFPTNPVSSDPWPFKRALTAEHTTARTGRFHIFEPDLEVHDFSFSGISSTSGFIDSLRDYGELNRRIYLIDHRNRAWTVVINGTDFVARKRTNFNGVLNDWVHDYTVRTTIYGNQWQVPA